MKSMASLGLAAACFLFAGSVAHAQYKSPRQYFPQGAPGSTPNNRTAPSSPATPATPGTPTAPARPAAPKFKDVGVNTQFFFTTDTNRAFPWTKITETTAKNSKGIVRAISLEQPVQR